MKDRKLGIIFFETLDEDLGIYILDNLKKIFQNLFDSFELIEFVLELPEKSFIKSRNQFLSSPLLRKLREFSIESDYYKIIGVINADLFTEGLNFIFGQAEFGEPEETRVAIVSTYRLKYGLEIKKIDKKTKYQRILKEIIHELGHTLKLSHCNNFCVMQYSNSLSEADEKPLNFCQRCQSKLKTIK